MACRIQSTDPASNRTCDKTFKHSSAGNACLGLALADVAALPTGEQFRMPIFLLGWIFLTYYTYYTLHPAAVYSQLQPSCLTQHLLPVVPGRLGDRPVATGFQPSADTPRITER